MTKGSSKNLRLPIKLTNEIFTFHITDGCSCFPGRIVFTMVEHCCHCIYSSTCYTPAYRPGFSFRVSFNIFIVGTTGIMDRHSKPQSLVSKNSNTFSLRRFCFIIDNGDGTGRGAGRRVCCNGGKFPSTKIVCVESC